MTEALTILWCLALGVLAGLLYYAALRWHVRALLGYAFLTALVAPFVRFAILAAALGLAVTQGALPLIACFIGLMIVRAIVLRRYRG
ncbi:MAG TPA: ATP synthase subunit I [Devosiaceae bacterium]